MPSTTHALLAPDVSTPSALPEAAANQPAQPSKEALAYPKVGEFFASQQKYRLSVAQAGAEPLTAEEAAAPLLSPELLEALRVQACCKERALISSDPHNAQTASTSLQNFYNAVARRLVRGAADFPALGFGNELRQWLQEAPKVEARACLSEVSLHHAEAWRAKEVTDRLLQVTGSLQRAELFQQLHATPDLPPALQEYCAKLAEIAAARVRNRAQSLAPSPSTSAAAH